MCRKERSAQPKFLPAGWRPTATLGPRGLTGVLVPCGQAKGAASPSLPTRLEVFATQDVWGRSAHRQPRSRNALERSRKPDLQLMLCFRGRSWLNRRAFLSLTRLLLELRPTYSLCQVRPTSPFRFMRPETIVDNKDGRCRTIPKQIFVFPIRQDLSLSSPSLTIVPFCSFLAL
jgi:hypothetical protein